MKKNVLIKGILVLVVITLLAIVFTGCVVITPTTGTVVITVSGDWLTQEVKMDGIIQGTFNPATSLTIYNVSVGNHFFESEAIDHMYYGFTFQNIHTGMNYVHIHVTHV